MTMARGALRWLVRLAPVLVVSAALAQQTPVFPGMEGFGAGTTGGAGGREIHVTTLAPDGPGSLREAIATEGPRIVKFDVAGTIELRGNALVVGWPFRPTWMEKTRAGEDPGHNPYSDLTIDGASASPPGITISGRMVIGYGAGNIILRHLRIRENGYSARSAADCICIISGCYNIMVDHCSLTWARDEVVNPWGLCGDITFQWCIFEGYGPHGFGPLNGAGSDRITIHHCLFAHNMGRNPLITGNVGRLETEFPNPNPIIDVRNNLIYGWFNVGGTALDNAAFVNLVGNRYLPGPNTDPTRICITVGGDAKAWLRGNISPNRPDDSYDEWADAGHHARDEQGVYQGIPGPWEHGLRADEAFPAPPITEQPADVAADLVRTQVGAWPRDPIDAGIIRTVLDGTGWAGCNNTRPEDYSNARPTARIIVAGVGRRLTFQGVGKDPDGEIALWSWDFGDGAVAIGPEHEYAAPGEYQVTLYGMDSRGMTSDSRATVTVAEDGPPVLTAEERLDWEDFPPPPPHEDHPWVTVEAPSVATEGFPADDAWETAPRLAPFIMQQDCKLVPEGDVDARVLHDGEWLYLRLDSLAPNAEGIRQGQLSDRPGPERWFYQGLEICVAPQWGREPWFQFVVNTNGEVRAARGFDLTWAPEPNWSAQSRVEGDRWILQIAIPLAAIEVTGDSCALKLARYRDKDEILIWPALGPGDAAGYWCRQTPEPDGYALVKLQ